MEKPTFSLVAFDMDGTLVDVPSSWQYVHQHFGENNNEALRLFQEDKIDDAEFIRRDVRLWHKHDPDLDLTSIDRILTEVPLMPGARELFDALRGHRITTAIISGGIDRLADRLSQVLHVDYVLANGFQIRTDGRLTGEGIVRVPIKRKGDALTLLQERLGLSSQQCAAVGNSDIDVALFERCKIGVAFLPADDTVRAGASHIVNTRDLSVLRSIFLSPELMAGTTSREAGSR